MVAYTYSETSLIRPCNKCMCILMFACMFACACLCLHACVHVYSCTHMSMHFDMHGEQSLTFSCWGGGGRGGGTTLSFSPAVKVTPFSPVEM